MYTSLPTTAYFPKGVVRIRILGDISLQVDEAILPMSGQNSKLLSVLCYLVFHRDRPVTQAELIENFYGDDDQGNPAGALKMQISRIRRMLSSLLEEGAVSVIGRRGTYQWNPALPCWVDAEAMELLCLEAQQPGQTKERQMACYRQVVDLYQGEPMLEKDGFLWSKVASARYHRLYVEAVEHYAALLEKEEAFLEMELLCRDAIEKEPASEALRVGLIRALLGQDQRKEARKQYQEAVEMLYRDLGVRPSPALQGLYPQCSEEDKPWEQDLSTVMASLWKHEEKRQAFLCPFEQFRSMYQLEVRRAMRTGACLHVAMLTVMGADGNVLPARVNHVLMEGVQDSVLTSLRQSDVVARYSSCQFIIMLPYANQEDSYRVMERIVGDYHRQNPKNVVRLTYQIREMDSTPPD
ncbi:MAG: hypothetical protein IJO69_03240 [Ruminiclostridium sp.]|nr:hypothetical protein [Ruminiclostridium sp.]MBQ9932833.1 hypothetical protein [Ruminiclostridium sp.]